MVNCYWLRICSLIRKSCLVSLVVLAFGACSSAPVQEMSDARQAIEAAQAVEAQRLASSEYDRARALLSEAQQLLGDGHYNKARKNALKARDHAIQARELAQESVRR